jgi:hypothetical protein
MPRPSSPPPFPPKRGTEEGTEKNGPALRVRPGANPGAEVFELDVDSEPPPAPRKASPDLPKASARTGGSPTIPAKPARASDPRRVDTLPTRREPGSDANEGDRATPTFDFGVPRPGFGGDTDLDTHLGSPESSRRSFEFALDLDLGKNDPDDPLSEALDLVGREEPKSSAPLSAPPQPASNPMGELREKYALGDFSGALAVAETILHAEPGHADAQRYAESCRDVLKQMYAARLGPLDQVPVVAVGGDQLRWLTLDHRAGFLLSHVDGVSTLEEILDVSGMPQLEAMRIIADLLAQKVIVLR